MTLTLGVSRSESEIALSQEWGGWLTCIEKDASHPFKTMILTSVTMLGSADVPYSDRGDFRRRRAVDISSSTHTELLLWRLNRLVSNRMGPHIRFKCRLLARDKLSQGHIIHTYMHVPDFITCTGTMISYWQISTFIKGEWRINASVNQVIIEGGGPLDIILIWLTLMHIKLYIDT